MSSKVLGDLFAGVPTRAYVNGPFVGERWELGSFQLGLSVQHAVSVVNQDFYVLFREDGPPLLSENGTNFKEKHENSFRFGFQMKGQEPTVVDLGLGIRR